MNILAPSITHSPFSARAVVRVAPASEPASGSVRPKAASRSPEASCGSQWARCASSPKSMIGIVPSEVCAATVIAKDESTRASSSMQSA